jgi:medium-chain acyl-[acyl-carrier-protein] hydrolase
MAYRDKPFAFFGHSMGAVISFELTRYLRREHGIQPCQLFVSGNPAPQVPPREPPIYDLPQSEFLNEIRQLNGTPPELLDHPELMSLLIPMLRADFKLVQTYVYSAESPLDCPITAFGGLDDEKVTREDLDAWREQTTGNFSIHMLPGDHFFIQTYQPLLLRRLSIELQQLASRVRGSVDDPRGRIFD